MLQLMFQLKLSKIEFKKSKQDDAVQIGRIFKYNCLCPLHTLY